MDMPLLTVTLSRSRRLAGALVGVHGLAAGCVIAVLPGWGAPLAACTLLAWSLGTSLRGEALRLGRKSIASFSVREDASCELHLRDGSNLAGVVRPSSFAAPWLITLVVRLDGGGFRTLAIPPDSTDAASHRRLRTWLRMRLRPPTAESGSA